MLVFVVFWGRNSSGSVESDSTECTVCCDRQADTIFMNCGHGGFCHVCATFVFRRTGDCCICRTPAAGVVFFTSQKFWFIIENMDPWIHGSPARAAAGAGATGSAAVCTQSCTYSGALRAPQFFQQPLGISEFTIS